MEFYIFVYKACAVSLYTILVREVDGRFVTLFFNMSQNDLKRPNRILLIFSAIHIKSLAFRFATPMSEVLSIMMGSTGWKAAAYAAIHSGITDAYLASAVYALVFTLFLGGIGYPLYLKKIYIKL